MISALICSKESLLLDVDVDRSQNVKGVLTAMATADVGDSYRLELESLLKQYREEQRIKSK